MSLVRSFIARSALQTLSIVATLSAASQTIDLDALEMEEANSATQKYDLADRYAQEGHKYTT